MRETVALIAVLTLKNESVHSGWARIHTHEHAHTRTHTRTHAHTHTRTRTRAHTLTHSRTLTHARTHACKLQVIDGDRIMCMDAGRVQEYGWVPVTAAAFFMLPLEPPGCL
jgi:hypothetical protein